MFKRFVDHLDDFLELLLAALPKYIFGFLILILGLYAIKFFGRFVRKAFERRQVEETLRGFLLSAIKVASYLILFTIVIGITGFKSMSLAAIFGAVGLTVGLALQGSLSNFAGGILILMFKPFRVGEYISNNSGTSGTVNEINLLYTTLTNDDGLKVFSPNGPLANSVITNYSAIVSRRYTFEVGISYKTDISVAQQVILKTLDEHDAVLKSPAPLVTVKKLSPSSVDLNIAIWMLRKDYWNTVFQVQKLVKEALDSAELKIAFPQTGLHIIKGEEVK